MTFFYIFFKHLFIAQHGRPRPPKRSIVASWAPKMIPKWRPKGSQIDNGRPLRNLRRRERIAYPPPLGSSIFDIFLRTEKTLKLTTTGPRFDILGHFGVPPGGPGEGPRTTFSQLFPLLSPRGSSESPQVTPKTISS